MNPHQSTTSIGVENDFGKGKIVYGSSGGGDGDGGGRGSGVSPDVELLVL